MTDDELDGLLGGLLAKGPVPAAPRIGPAEDGDEAEEDAGDPELDALIGGLKARGPVPPAPALPRQRARVPVWWGAVALAAAVLLAVGLSQWRPEPRVTARGRADVAVDLLLELSVDRGGGAERIGPGETISVDDTLYFRIGATPAAPVVLWVEENGLRQTVAEQEAAPEPSLVAQGGGLVGYRADGPGPLLVGLRSGEAELTMALRVAEPEKNTPRR